LFEILNIFSTEELYPLTLSPVDLEITDPDGLTISKDNINIPNAQYLEIDIFNDLDYNDIIIIPDFKLGDYLITVIPEPGSIPDETYSLVVTSLKNTVVLAKDIKLSDIPLNPYIIRSIGTKIFHLILATIDFNPDTLNKKSQGEWITCYIELPEDFNVSNITISSILLNNIVPSESNPINISDYDYDGLPDLMVKFSKSEVAQILQSGDDVEITVSGELNDGTKWEGVDFIKVI
jgi:hypothetical protein